MNSKEMDINHVTKGLKNKLRKLESDKNVLLGDKGKINIFYFFYDKGKILLPKIEGYNFNIKKII